MSKAVKKKGSRRTAGGRAKRFVIVASKFNEDITGALQRSAARALRDAGVPERNVTTVWVPGGYEIPWAAAKAVKTLKPHAVICVGCVLQGETKQNHYIAQAIYSNLQQLSMDTGVPVTVGVLTVDDLAQARARTSGPNDRGEEAALAALEVAGG